MYHAHRCVQGQFQSLLMQRSMLQPFAGASLAFKDSNNIVHNVEKIRTRHVLLEPGPWRAGVFPVQVHHPPWKKKVWIAFLAASASKVSTSRENNMAPQQQFAPNVNSLPPQDQQVQRILHRASARKSTT
jgi:hypothetical protein